MTLDAQDYFSAPLFDLFEVDKRFAGVYSPEAERNIEKIGISSQFLENAELYHERYSSLSHFSALFSQVFSEIGYDEAAEFDILDIGAGSGINSTVPLLRMFPKGKIIATDLSPQLLAILRSYLPRLNYTNRAACVCTDAMNNHFHANRFDLVTGTAILHHLLDPVQAISAAYRALKRGGVAIFMEPFEAGCMMQVANFRHILGLNALYGDLPVDVERLLNAMILDYTTRAGTDKSAAHFPHMDDKWLFTRNYLDEAAKRTGFKEVRLISHDSDNLCRQSLTVLLRLSGGISPDSVPDWAWKILDDMDSAISRELKAEMSIEKTVVLFK
ncbi:MAG TPA: class I SAM-dependent methyltransferase [Bosea sp. (in: a-proteobacteria)]|jgi:ubiquinone/menaquinone biosynthesis C-methylase UbiE|uniref:class I SAM-dependent methyltransferase n=1 Tax=Bosea sp. (in: a-proteobacteria) TaxID=1871050 RepID=UPI002E14CB5D|nr:class I SAM-dependent methyltransferase [Bosea sp. (in: a-proteobacteria)]